MADDAELFDAYTKARLAWEKKTGLQVKKCYVSPKTAARATATTAAPAFTVARGASVTAGGVDWYTDPTMGDGFRFE